VNGTADIDAILRCKNKYTITNNVLMAAATLVTTRSVPLLCLLLTTFPLKVDIASVQVAQGFCSVQTST